MKIKFDKIKNKLIKKGEIEVNIKERKISLTEAEKFISSSDYGASIYFTGTVRNQNNNKSVIGITYDSHDALVIKILTKWRSLNKDFKIRYFSDKDLDIFFQENS